jgi:Zn-dependent protease with chaperone function
MADAADFYPPVPANVPPDLAKASTSYRVRVLVVLASLFVFAALYLGLTLGSGYLCYRSFAPASRGNSASREVLLDAERTDERLSKVLNQAVERRKQNQIDDRQFLLILETELLPPWRAQRQRLAAVGGLPVEEQRVFEKLVKAFRLQEESWELLAAAIRGDDQRAADESREKARTSQLFARQAAADAQRYYASGVRPQRGESDDMKIILGIISGLLCLFLVKGFFKWRRADQDRRLEVTEKDQPRLFAFIRRLCRETRAPLPRRVYITPDVNAAVFYNPTLLSLVLPTRKNLIIGLGLVNQLTLSEFKAVLAHEFGHFSQSSMKLGGYVYMSNRVIADVVFARDWLDHLVSGLRRVDFRIAIFAWTFTGLIWGVRKTLQGLFKAINFANSSLSRQMEYNADLVAVSVAGSDALIHALARLNLAAEALGQAWEDLTAAADRKHFTRDLYYHQTRAVEHVRARRRDPNYGEPPALPEDPGRVVQVFQPEDTTTPKMWATHPSNYDREVNAKSHYIRGPMDNRSPWLLFLDSAALREKVTLNVYEAARLPRTAEPEPPEVVQAFIDEEHAQTTYHPRYQGLYDHRYLTPGDLSELIQAATSDVAGTEQLSEAHALLYGDELKARMQAHQGRQEEFRRVAPIAHGVAQLKGADFQFRGVRHRAADARRLFDLVKSELDQDYEWMSSLDRQTFLVHFGMARRIGDDTARELEDRYRFHVGVQAIHGRLAAEDQQVRTTLGQLAGRQELTQDEFRTVQGVLREAHAALRQLLDAAGGLRLPSLKNLPAGEPLGPLLLNAPIIPALDASSNFDGKWIGRLLEQMGQVSEKAQRIHFKSLGAILALQEKIAERFAALGRESAEAVAVRT